MLRRSGLLALALCVAAGNASAAMPEALGVATVPAPGPHWIWVDDIAFGNLLDGRAYLVDADSGRVFGMLSTGGLFAKLDWPADYGTIYSVETYYSRGSRGTRTDVVTSYDPATLAPTGEVVISARRQTGVPMISFTAVTDDDRHLIVYNFNPAQSVTIVDLAQRKVAGELATPGCALVYPAGPARFAMLCQDGSVLLVRLNENGTEAARTKSEPFFDPKVDPITERGVRLGDRWLFASFEGRLHEIDVSKEAASFPKPWALVGEADAKESWKVGGAQHLAIHAATGRLYSLMHVGGADSHKAPGAEVWVYDVAKKARVQRIVLQHPAMSIVVTQDAAPVMVATDVTPKLEVYDALSGEHRRTIEGIGQSPMLLQAVPSGAR
jgi:methylamine dehydrogenase heavy chain